MLSITLFQKVIINVKWVWKSSTQDLKFQTVQFTMHFKARSFSITQSKKRRGCCLLILARWFGSSLVSVPPLWTGVNGLPWLMRLVPAIDRLALSRIGCNRLLRIVADKECFLVEVNMPIKSRRWQGKSNGWISMVSAFCVREAILNNKWAFYTHISETYHRLFFVTTCAELKTSLYHVHAVKCTKRGTNYWNFEIIVSLAIFKMWTCKMVMGHGETSKHHFVIRASPHLQSPL